MSAPAIPSPALGTPSPTFLLTGAIVFDRAHHRDGWQSPSSVLQSQPRLWNLLWETPDRVVTATRRAYVHSCVWELREEAGLGVVLVGTVVHCLAIGGEGTEWGEMMGSQFLFYFFYQEWGTGL